MTPGLRVTPGQVLNDKKVEEGNGRLFRASAARAKYLSAGRIDVTFAAKGICRSMSSPMESSIHGVKRLGRYLGGRKRLVYRYPRQTIDKTDVSSDTDWAVCPRTRKSTSGGCIMAGLHMTKPWSSTQLSQAPWSAEAEYYGLVKAARIRLYGLDTRISCGISVRHWTEDLDRQQRRHGHRR